MTRRWHWFFRLSLLTTICFRGVCIADDSTMPRLKPLVGMISLIVKEPVQKELGIDPQSEELANIKAILKPFSSVLQDRLNRPSQADIANQLSHQELYAQIESEFVEQLRLVLSPEQFRRLREIHWQRWGIRSIEDPEMAEALELSPDQMKTIFATRSQFGTRRRELESEQAEARGQNRSEFKEKLNSLEAGLNEAYGALLSPEQTARFKELKGMPFDTANPSQSAEKKEPNGTLRTSTDSLLLLVLMEPVLEELGIGPATPQMISLHTLYRAYTAERRELSPTKLPDSGQRIADPEAVFKLQNKYEAELKQELTPQQFQRLREIQIQRMGTNALGDAEVATYLNLTDAQKSQLADLNREKLLKTRNLVRLARSKEVAAGLGDEVRKKIQDSLSETENAAFEILTQEQRVKWQELTGKPFDLSKLRRSVTPN